MSRVVVEQEPNPGGRRVDLVQFTQQSDEVRARVVVADDLGDSTRVKIEAGQQRHRSQPLVFVISKLIGEPIRLWRQIWSRRRKRLNPGFLVVGDRNERRLFQRNG